MAKKIEFFEQKPIFKEKSLFLPSKKLRKNAPNTKKEHQQY